MSLSFNGPHIVGLNINQTLSQPLCVGNANPTTCFRTTQQITRVSGAARIGGKEVLLEEARLRGERFSFKLALNGKMWDFTGTVKGSAIEGTVADVGGGTKAAWSAAVAK